MTNPEVARGQNDMKNIEIERKFLVDPALLPPGSLQNGKHIKQVYTAISPDGSELRLRSIDDRTFEQTMKSGGGLVREEVTVAVPRAYFDVAWNDEQHPRIEKTRYKIPQGYQAIEIDVYDGVLKGLVTAEAEFQAISQSLALQRAKAFQPPEWCIREVTTDKLYKNQSLAARRSLGELAISRFTA